MNLSRLLHPELVEASIYLADEHHPVTVSNMEVRRKTVGEYRIETSGSAKLDVNGRLIYGPFHLHCDVSCGGVVVIPDNLFPKPANPNEASVALAQFIGLDGLRKARWEDFKYVFGIAS